MPDLLGHAVGPERWELLQKVKGNDVSRPFAGWRSQQNGVAGVVRISLPLPFPHLLTSPPLVTATART